MQTNCHCTVYGVWLVSFVSWYAVDDGCNLKEKRKWSQDLNDEIGAKSEGKVNWVVIETECPAF